MFVVREFAAPVIIDATEYPVQVRDIKLWPELMSNGVFWHIRLADKLRFSTCSRARCLAIMIVMQAVTKAADEDEEEGRRTEFCDDN